MKTTPTRTARRLAMSSLALGLGIAISVAGAGQANAATTWVDLGTADSFAVLAGQAITDVPTSVISGDVGVLPGTSITGLTAAEVSGTIYKNVPPADTAQADLTTAYLDSAGRSGGTAVAGDELAGQTLIGGVYTGDALLNSGTLTLQGDANSVWIFQAASSLTFASDSEVVLVGGANPCNVFWQVTSSATLDTGSTVVGTVMALTSIDAKTGATVEGRLLARNGTVSLDTNTITAPTGCVAPAVTPPVVTPPVTAPGLADSGVDSGPYLVAILTLIGGGAALLLFSGSRSRSRRSGRHSA